jgi:hypothetical protein
MESEDHQELMEERENKLLQLLLRDRLHQPVKLKLLIKGTNPEQIWVEVMDPLLWMMKLRKLKIFKELDTSREFLIYQQIVLIFQVFQEMIADNNRVILDL